MEPLRFFACFLLAATVLPSSRLLVGAQQAQYNFTIGPTQCYACLAGTITVTDGLGTCSPCDPGYYQVGVHCVCVYVCALFACKITPKLTGFVCVCVG